MLAWFTVAVALLSTIALFGNSVPARACGGEYYDVKQTTVPGDVHGICDAQPLCGGEDGYVPNAKRIYSCVDGEPTSEWFCTCESTYLPENERWRYMCPGTCPEQWECGLGESCGPGSACEAISKHCVMNSSGNGSHFTACESSSSGPCECSEGATEPCSVEGCDGNGLRHCYPRGGDGQGTYWGDCFPTNTECREEGECDPDFDVDCCVQKINQPIEVLTGEVEYEAPPDLEIFGASGNLVLRRYYSSHRAVIDAARNKGVGVEEPVQSWGGGWSHQFETRLAGTDRVFDPVTGMRRFVNGHVDGHDGVTTLFTQGPFVVLTESDGTRKYFGSVVGATGMKLVSVVEPSGRPLELRYYSEAESDVCYALPGTSQYGRLCLVTSTIDSSSIWFSEYSQLACTEGTCTGCVGLCGSSEPVLTKVMFGIGDDPTEYDHRIAYEYSVSLLVDADGLTCVDRSEACEGDIAPQLVSVVEQVISASTTQVAEQYAYTTMSYYRPDLSNTPYASPPTAILAAVGSGWRAVPRLSRVTDGASNFKEGHQYDQRGYAATGEAPGEFVRLEYVFGSLGLIGIVVTNESVGATSEFTVVNGRITAQSGDCQCSVDAIIYSRFSNGQVSGKTAANGTTTSYGYDGQGRIVLRSKNFVAHAINDLPSPQLWWTNNGQPISVEYRRYDLPSSNPTFVSPYFSAVCHGVTAPIACPSYSSLPGQRQELDSTAEITGPVGYTLTNLIPGPVQNAQYQERLTERARDSWGRLSSESYSNGSSRLYYYYPNTGTASSGRLNRIAFKASPIDGEADELTISSYDDLGRPTSQTSNGLTTAYTYDSHGRVLNETSGLGGELAIIEHRYLPSGRLCESLVRADDNSILGVTAFAYGPQVATASDACTLPSPSNPCVGNYTTGQSAATIAALQQTCLSYLASYDRLVAQWVADANGVRSSSTESIYDFRGRPVQETTRGDSPSVERSITHSYVGTSEEIVATSVGPGTAYQVDVALDSSGAPIATTTSLGSTVVSTETLTRDVLGRVTNRTKVVGLNPMSTTFKYDARDNIIEVIEGSTTTMKAVFDDFGAPLYRTVRGTPDFVTFNAYNSSGRLTRRRTNATDVFFNYDSGGRLLSNCGTADCLDTASSIQLYYDAVPPELPTGIYLCGESAHEISYNHTSGRLVGATHPGGWSGRSYDSRGRLAATYSGQDGDIDGCAWLVTRYSYDAADRVTQMQYPSGVRVVFGYESGPHPSSVSVFDTTQSEIAAMSNVHFTHRGALRTYDAWEMHFEASYDGLGRFQNSNLIDESGTKASWVVSERDLRGNVLHAQEAVSGKHFRASYSPRDQVVQTSASSASGYQDCYFDYRSSSVGDREFQGCGGPDIFFDSAGEELAATWMTSDLDQCSVDGAARRQAQMHYQPNGDGSFTREATDPYPVQDYSIIYDYAGRVSAVEKDDSIFIYQYDYAGMRVAKIDAVGDVVTRYSYNSSGYLLSECQDSTCTSYVYAGATPVFVIVTTPSTSDAYLLISDYKQQPVGAFDVGGNVAWQADAELFGRAWIKRAAPGLAINLRFPGQIYDAETGLHYNGQRYYDPNLGRFLSPDPQIVVREDGIRSATTYAINNPARYLDVSGGVATEDSDPWSYGGLLGEEQCQQFIHATTYSCHQFDIYNFCRNRHLDMQAEHLNATCTEEIDIATVVCVFCRNEVCTDK